MTKKILRVVALTVNEQTATFYTVDGQVHTVRQGDPRLKDLIKRVSAGIARGESVEVDLAGYSTYSKFEEESKGFIRFFRAAANKVVSIVESFWGQPQPTREEQAIIDQMDKVSTETLEAVAAETQATGTVKEPEAPKKPRYEDLKDDLAPVQDHGLPEPTNENETLVAVIGGDVVIPGVEKLKPYIDHALKTNSTKAVENFLKRIAAVIDQRGHSIPDLLEFLSKGDLPLAENGDIIAYKILKTNPSEGTSKRFPFVDCHTGKVLQGVGTYVRVKEHLVDRNRANECSNGLHIARRGYIRNFYGDVCTLIAMAPEDVIAVPHNDANKVRVCGYRILAVLPQEAYSLLKQNKPITSIPEAQALLAKAIAGDFTEVREEVWIGAQNGQSLSIVNKAWTGPDCKKDDKGNIIEAPVETPSTEPKTKTEVVTEVEESVSETIEPEKLKKAISVDVDDDDNKKANKVSINEVRETFQAEKMKATKAPKKKKAPVTKTTKKVPVTKAEKQKEAASSTAPNNKKSPTAADKARTLFEAWINTNDPKKLEELYALKKKVKKSWKVLGFDTEEEQLINS